MKRFEAEDHIWAQAWPTTVKVVALVLLSHRDHQTGWCYPSRSRIAEMAGCSEKTVTRALATLVESGAATREKRRVNGRMQDGFDLLKPSDVRDSVSDVRDSVSSRVKSEPTQEPPIEQTKEQVRASAPAPAQLTLTPDEPPRQSKKQRKAAEDLEEIKWRLDAFNRIFGKKLTLNARNPGGRSGKRIDALRETLDLYDRNHPASRATWEAACEAMRREAEATKGGRFDRSASCDIIYLVTGWSNWGTKAKAILIQNAQRAAQPAPQPPEEYKPPNPEGMAKVAAILALAGVQQ